MNEIRLEKENAGLRDRVAELEAAISMLVLGANRGGVLVDHLEKIYEVIKRGKPDSPETIAKIREYYE